MVRLDGEEYKEIWSAADKHGDETKLVWDESAGIWKLWSRSFDDEILVYLSRDDLVDLRVAVERELGSSENSRKAPWVRYEAG